MNTIPSSPAVQSTPLLAYCAHGTEHRTFETSVATMRSDVAAILASFGAPDSTIADAVRHIGMMSPYHRGEKFRVPSRTAPDDGFRFESKGEQGTVTVYLSLFLRRLEETMAKQKDQEMPQSLLPEDFPQLSSVIRPTGKEQERRFRTRVNVAGIQHEFDSSENTLRTNLYVTILASEAMQALDRDERMDVVERLEAALEMGKTRYRDEHVQVDFDEVSMVQAETESGAWRSAA